MSAAEFVIDAIYQQMRLGRLPPTPTAIKLVCVACAQFLGDDMPNSQSHLPLLKIETLPN